MKTVHLLPRVRYRIILSLLVCTLAGLIGASTLIPSNQSRAIDQTEHLVEHQILSVDGLINLRSDTAFGGLPPLPGTQPYDHPVGLYAVDWYAGGFSKEFLDSLVAVEEHGVPVYRLRVYQDQRTREMVIENADGVEIYSEPCAFEEPFCSAFSYALHINPELHQESMAAQAQFVAHNDPARYGILVDLVPVDQAFDLLYARALSQNLLQSLAAQSLTAPLNPGGGGGAMMMSMSGGSGESKLTGIELLTNGIQIEMTSSFSSVTAFDLFGSDNLPPHDWNLIETDILLTNGQTSTKMISTQDLFRVYALGQANDHADGDGVRDSFEFFLYDTSLENLNDGLVGHWDFEETTGIYFEDCVNTNHGIIRGTSASAGGVGPVGRAMRFDGVNDPDEDLDFVFIEDDSALDVQTNLTVAVWINPDEADSDRRGLIYKRQAYIFAIDEDNIQFYGYGLSNEGYHTAPQIIPTGTWTHVAATYNGSNVLFYIDGEYVHTSIAVTGLLDNSTRELGLGYGPGSSSRYFRGWLDDARIYNTVLSSNQIYSLYEIGADADSDGLSLVNESQALTDHTNSDTDNDGLSDKDELELYLTDPTSSNEFADISGTVTYKGSSTGQVVVIASPTRFGWDTSYSDTLSTPGAFSITNIPVRTNYWIKAFRDLNSNGVYEASEPASLVLEDTDFSSLGVTNASVHVEKIRAMRVDFAYYAPPAYTAQGAANKIVSDALDWGVNTIYALAYSWDFGTYWNNQNPFLVNEPTYGANNPLPKLIQTAHSNNIEVVAWIQPLNSFRTAWFNNPSWRAEKIDGTYEDDNPLDPALYWLSAFNTNAVNWMMDVVEEILDLGVDGIDISETIADPTFGQNLSYDDAANVAFSNRYPGVTIGVGDWEQKWVDFRSEVFTSNIYQRVGELIRARSNVAYHVTSSIPVDSDGTVKTAHANSDNTGFDWNRVMDLPEEVRPDIMNGQFLWQQQVVLKCDTITFTPDWSESAFRAAVDRTQNRMLFVSHPEISTAPATNTNCPSIGPITPTASQFETSMFHGMTNSAGADFYMHHLIDTSAEESAVSNVFFNTP